MRWTMGTLAILVWLTAAPAPGLECGTIRTTGATIETGAAPLRPTPRIEPCAGPALHPGILPADTRIEYGELTAVFADPAPHLHAGHDTSVSGTFDGGSYTFGDYVIPADVTITYSAATTILALGDVRILGTVRTEAPNAGLHIECTGEFRLGNTFQDPARIETAGRDSLPVLARAPHRERHLDCQPLGLHPGRQGLAPPDRADQG